MAGVLEKDGLHDASNTPWLSMRLLDSKMPLKR